MATLKVDSYAVASKLIGFRTSELRVRITRIDGDDVFVITCDLLDAGTRLCLDASQVVAEQDMPCYTTWQHRDGLVAFAA